LELLTIIFEIRLTFSRRKQLVLSTGPWPFYINPTISKFIFIFLPERRRQHILFLKIQWFNILRF